MDKNELRRLIATDRIQNVINRLRNSINTSEGVLIEHQNELFLLEAKLRELESGFSLGLLDYQNSATEKQKIRKALLEFISKLDKEEGDLEKLDSRVFKYIFIHFHQKVNLIFDDWVNSFFNYKELIKEASNTRSLKELLLYKTRKDSLISFTWRKFINDQLQDKIHKYEVAQEYKENVENLMMFPKEFHGKVENQYVMPFNQMRKDFTEHIAILWEDRYDEKRNEASLIKRKENLQEFIDKRIFDLSEKFSKVEQSFIELKIMFD